MLLCAISVLFKEQGITVLVSPLLTGAVRIFMGQAFSSNHIELWKFLRCSTETDFNKQIQLTSALASFQGLCSAFDIIIQNRVDLLHIVGLRSVAQAIVKPPGLDNNSNKRHAQSRSPSHSNHSTPTRSSVQTAQVCALLR